jgi:hypothetical protein
VSASGSPETENHDSVIFNTSSYLTSKTCASNRVSAAEAGRSPDSILAIVVLEFQPIRYARSCWPRPAASRKPASARPKAQSQRLNMASRSVAVNFGKTQLPQGRRRATTQEAYGERIALPSFPALKSA